MLYSNGSSWGCAFWKILGYWKRKDKNSVRKQDGHLGRADSRGIKSTWPTDEFFEAESAFGLLPLHSPEMGSNQPLGTLQWSKKINDTYFLCLSFVLSV